MLNFKPRFVEPIRAGTKAHTIRADRKIPIKVGDNLYLYCGARQPGCFRILDEPVPCTMVETIEFSLYRGPSVMTIVGGLWLEEDEVERLAVADGFPNFAEMMKFWEGRLPFKGLIIHWKPPVQHG